jgi:prefoldin subunit 5
MSFGGIESVQRQIDMLVASLESLQTQIERIADRISELELQLVEPVSECGY